MMLKKIFGYDKCFEFWSTSPWWNSARIDRIVMLLADKQNIREVTLFPMNQNAQDLMMNAPSEVDDKQLKELSIKTVKKDN